MNRPPPPFVPPADDEAAREIEQIAADLEDPEKRRRAAAELAASRALVSACRRARHLPPAVSRVLREKLPPRKSVAVLQAEQSKLGRSTDNTQYWWQDQDKED